LAACGVSIRHADDPSSGDSIEDKKGPAATNAASTILADNEEFGYIENLGIGRCWRTTCGQRKADNPTAIAY
jgi:hypothetical protein